MKKNKAAADLGRRGGLAAAKCLTPEQRRKRAQDAVGKRWAKRPKKEAL